MNNLDKLFNQIFDKEKLTLEKNHKESIEKHYDFVKGSDFCKGYYDNIVVDVSYVRFYQIALFNDYPKNVINSGIALVPKNPRRCIRSFLLRGKNAKGACFFEWEIIEIKNYKISEKKLNTFIEFLSSKTNNKSNIKIKHKFYPVYNFDHTEPPSGNEINKCVSELLN